MTVRAIYRACAAVACAAFLCIPAVSLAGDTERCFGRRATIVGTPASETLRGTDGTDVIVAQEGDDTIKARQGSTDYICSGAGKDLVESRGGFIHGGIGRDRVFAGRFDAVVKGDEGNDRIEAGDHLDGGPGDDFLKGVGGEGRDVLFGGPGDDEMVGRGGDVEDSTVGDVLNFTESPNGLRFNTNKGRVRGWGNDTYRGSISEILASDHDDFIKGDPGDLKARAGDDEWDGGSDSGYVELGPGRDVAHAGGGRDFLIPGRGDDRVHGDGGRDRLYFDYYLDGITVNVATRTARGEGDDTFGGIEVFLGTGGADSFRGDDGRNRFYPLDGNDVVNAGGGDDFVEESGGGRANGGPGDDFLDARGAGNVILDGGSGTDTCLGGDPRGSCEVTS